MPYATIIIIMLDMYLFVFILISDITFEPYVTRVTLTLVKLNGCFFYMLKILEVIFYLILYIYHIFLLRINKFMIN